MSFFRPRTSFFQPTLALLTYVVAASTGHAQIAPSAGDVQRQIDQSTRLPPVTTPPQPAPSQADTHRQGPQIVIRQVDIEGASLISKEELTRQLDIFINKPMTMAELEAASQSLVGYYRERGWFARVQLPEQDITDGVLRIRIVEGRFGKIDLQPSDSRANLDYVSGIVGNGLKSGEPYSLANLERGLLIANDLPGVRATGTLRAGSQSGTSDLALSVTDRPWLSGSLGVNNFGNRFTGVAQATGNLAVNNMSGFGDQLRFSGLLGDSIGYAGVNYSVPVGNNGLKANVGYSQVHYRLGKQFADLDSKGQTRALRAGLDFSLIRSSERNLWLGLDVARTRQEDKSLDFVLRDRTLTTATVELRGDNRDDWGGGGSTVARIALTQGYVDLHVSGDQVQDAAGPRVAGSFTHLGLDLRRDQVWTSSLYLRSRIAGQLALDNLDSSQQFGLGGPYNVRGYPVNEASGDSGVLVQLELHSLLPWTSISGLDGYVFVDAGHIRQRHTTLPGSGIAGRERNSYPLYSTGFGVSWSNFRGFVISGVVALPIGSNPGGVSSNRNQDGRKAGPRIWVTLSQAF